MIVDKQLIGKRVEQVIDERKLYKWIKAQINPYGKPFEGTVFEFGNKVMEHIEAMENQPQTDKWIPCEERLPDKTMLCLCTVERGVTPFHGLNPIIDWWIAKENEQVSLFDEKKGHWKSQYNKVIAWQPLPQPYKKEGVKNE